MKRLVTDNYHDILEYLSRRQRRSGGVAAQEIAEELELTTTIHPLAARMRERGWIRYAGRESRSGSALVSFEITRLGKAALRYARAERRNGS